MTKAEFRAWQLEHYAERLANTTDPKTKSFLRTELHRLKKPGDGISTMPIVGYPMPGSIHYEIHTVNQGAGGTSAL